ncbi:MAG: hypothetical protein FWH20_09290 [Oscillospiraceae bacterium]|nr:hypothetical protein [Oscillospiraceae bacterium]
MIFDLDILVEKLAALEKLLAEYGGLTNRLTAVDIEVIDEARVIFDEREKLITQMKVIEPQVAELISRQEPDTIAVIQKMMAGETVMARFSKDEKVLQSKIISLLSVQNAVVKAENDIRALFKSKYDEVREELGKLNAEKKRINFYQNVAGEEKKGTKFDTQN